MKISTPTFKNVAGPLHMLVRTYVRHRPLGHAAPPEELARAWRALSSWINNNVNTVLLARTYWGIPSSFFEIGVQYRPPAFGRRSILNPNFSEFRWYSPIRPRQMHSILSVWLHKESSISSENSWVVILDSYHKFELFWDINTTHFYVQIYC